MKLAFLLLVPVLAWGSPFRYDDLEQAIRDRRVTSLEETLALLPSEFATNYTLMKRSRSLQPASPSAPRVIAFGNDGKLLLAYNGDPASDLEVIQFRDASKTFEFRRIHFNADKPPIFSSPNPHECTVCHTARLRPNWDRYPNWEGAFGEFDDVVTGRELDALRDFFADAPKQPRYAWLQRPVGSEASPFEVRSRGRLRFRPSFRLAGTTFRWQAEAIHAALGNRAARLLFAIGRFACASPRLDPATELKKRFGAQAADPLGPWPKPDTKNLFAFVLRGAGLTPRQFTTELVPDGKSDPYFMHCGIPIDLDEGKQGGVIELTHAVAGEVLAESPELSPFLRLVRWVEKRFASDPLDLPFAGALDDAMRIYDVNAAAASCPKLLQEYEQTE